MDKLIDKLFPSRVRMRLLAYMVRASFERGYRCASPDADVNEWREGWRGSKERDILVGMKLIGGEEKWR